MSKVILSSDAEYDFLKNLFLFSEEDKISLRYWISFVEEYGILDAQKNSNFRDHALAGIWEGFRSASFGHSARIIYQIRHEKIEIVEIAKITINHDYSRIKK